MLTGHQLYVHKKHIFSIWSRAIQKKKMATVAIVSFVENTRKGHVADRLTNKNREKSHFFAFFNQRFLRFLIFKEASG